jgi:hypothetical protein
MFREGTQTGKEETMYRVRSPLVEALLNWIVRRLEARQLRIVPTR